MAYDDDAARRVLRNTTTDDADVETVGDVDDNIKASDVDEIWEIGRASCRERV